MRRNHQLAADARNPTKNFYSAHSNDDIEFVIHHHESFLVHHAVFGGMRECIRRGFSGVERLQNIEGHKQEAY
jgi:hypothetical protein